MAEQRGYWNESDGSAVDAATAHDRWAQDAYGVLTEIATEYGGLITYGELAELVQEDSGIRTSVQQHHWIGKVLSRVVAEAHAEGVPPLTALVVRKDTGLVGEAYAEVLATEGAPVLDDVLASERHAAGARLRCYEYFGADLPPGGGVPTLAPEFAAKVARLQRTREVPVGTPCPNCFVIMPASGVCDTCG
ncbi:hypothetical protein [Cellulomonas sp. PhB143]|uniref:hypothetical protein n=1 Tax=Cellulomonas sp. PhB143 TaxID=2485186 RepID=UPI000FBF4809|nr:hypothetical protein [Cellulomonas sp. PhB143]ROS79127.1 hypothetical protein EDF32_0009 [Cellulomonas sp. PhB143]